MCVVQVIGSARWTVHNRLQELGMTSSCQIGQPLFLQVNTPQEAIELWGVTRLNQSSRQELVNWLNFCLQQPSQEIKD